MCAIRSEEHHEPVWTEPRRADQEEQALLLCGLGAHRAAADLLGLPNGCQGCAQSDRKNIMNQLGLNLGGPIKRNKLFFFADWERTEQRQIYSGFQTVATDVLKQGDFSGTGTTIYDPSTGTATGTGRQPFPNNKIPTSAMSAAALKMAALIEHPTTPGGVSNDYFFAGGWSFGRDNIDAKINYNPTDRSAIFVRYSIAPNRVFDAQTLGAAGGGGGDRGKLGNGCGKTPPI